MVRLHSLQILEGFSVNVFAMGDAQEKENLFVECKNQSVNLFYFCPPNIFITMQFLDVQAWMKDVLSEQLNDVPALSFYVSG